MSRRPIASRTRRSLWTLYRSRRGASPESDLAIGANQRTPDGAVRSAARRPGGRSVIIVRMRRCALFQIVLLVGCGGADTKRAADAGVPDAAPISAALNKCDPAHLPMNRATPLACCQKDDEAWFISGNQSSLGTLVHRRHAKACTLADGVTGGCNGMDCTYGPCGATNLETFPPPSHVFHPLSDPTVCGREASTLPGVPEAWTGAQEPYGTVTPACPWTGCTTGGPVVSLAVTTTAATATGRVTSAPAGIDITGAGTATVGFSVLETTLTATPTGDHARAVFSGDCAATGDYGKSASCKVTLGPEKTVTVAFDCEGGYTCSP
jgi:hypothetical protein